MRLTGTGSTDRYDSSPAGSESCSSKESAETKFAILPDGQPNTTKVQVGPCPADTYKGHSFADAKGDAPAYVMCFSQIK